MTFHQVPTPLGIFVLGGDERKGQGLRVSFGCSIVIWIFGSREMSGFLRAISLTQDNFAKNPTSGNIDSIDSNF
ncbi:hypothetical protein IQ247_29620 [Plectonema cf. radiosum LEGE 06105]|uniref:Uncharacterized protein n=1 Tax=Plectonema cf. radiosum LEGE 06105 TaxID=945769 RepID=A0A8J7JWE4_9CYAN|nr:hypothetical protein [Plectonema radiosum]MBE9216764.1 hypothetical protein [Plectonema cf. radiosum LEGE 06105]